jgi:hypothetical protein
LYEIEQFIGGCTILGSNLGLGTDVMNQNWIYFLSVVIGAMLSYLINQLPGVPDSIKSWLWFPVIGLMLLSVWVGLRLMSDSKESKRSQHHVVKNLKGRNIQVEDVTVESRSGELGDYHVVDGLEATGDIDLGNISVK